MKDHLLFWSCLALVIGAGNIVSLADSAGALGAFALVTGALAVGLLFREV